MSISVYKRVIAVGTLRQFIKYGIVGASGFTLHVSLVYALTEWVGLWYLHSTVVAAGVAWISNFTLNKLWTFKQP
jgi:dolichol-phosphate mannosyltransferase